MAGNHYSGTEDETLAGAIGADRFFIGPADGNDTITDFTNGEDRIYLKQFATISSFSDLTITSDATGVTIDLTAHGGGTIFLQGFSVGDLDASDFVFAIVGTDDDDTLVGDGTSNTIYGGAGDDTLSGNVGGDWLYGGAGNDTIYGGDGDGLDRIHGGAGNDTIYGGDGLGIDWLYGGEGSDTIYGGEFQASIKGGEGDDVIYGAADFSRIWGEAGDDEIHAGDGGDELYGGEGDDTLYGGDERDHLYGGEGNDTLYGGDGRDYLYGGEGDDTLYGGTEGEGILNGFAMPHLEGGAGNDTLFGGEGNEIIAGDAGNDFLYGGTGNDHIYGGTGSDVIDGGAGNDGMSGDNSIGSGFSGSEDTFVFQQGHGNDTISMFKDGEDKIDLTAFTEITSFDDLTIRTASDGVVIDLTEYGGGTIRFEPSSVEGIEIGDLDGGNFVLYEGTYEVEVTETSLPETPQEQIQQQTVSEPSGEDLSRDSSTSGRIAVGDTATGRIGSNGDRDWFAVELVAGRTYVIDLRGSPTDDGTLSDPYLRGIYDSDGNRISNTANDDGGQGLNSQVTFTATESGTHYIAAGAYSGQGTYEVEVMDTSPPIVAPDPDPEDPPVTQEQVQQQPPAFGSQLYGFELPENTDGSANRISLGTVLATDPDGGSVTYSIEGGNAAGLFEIDAASGELFYTGGGEDYDTGSTSFELTVRASDGDQTTDTTVAVNVTDVDEQVVVDPPVTQPDQSTPQTVSEPSGEDFSASTSTSGRVAVGDTATGNIGGNGDRDWFAVELVAGRTYVIDLRGSPTDDSTLSDPYLRGVYDADGNLIPRTTNDDGGQGYNSRLTFTATESGTHHIAAGAYSGQGTYEVEVTDTSPPIVGPDPDSGDLPDRQEQVQQQPPAFGSQFYTFELPENTDGSADRISLGTVSATDPGGGSVTYSIEGGNAVGAVRDRRGQRRAVLHRRGARTTRPVLPSFDLTVRASEGDQTTDTTVTVNVTDVAEAPAFAQAGHAFDLAEDTDGSTNRVISGHGLGDRPGRRVCDLQHRGRQRGGAVRDRRGQRRAVLHGRGRGLRDRFHQLRADCPGE